MIEMVYSGKDSEEQGEVRIPKNIKQIGNNKAHKKVYVEDYVMTCLRRKTEKENYIKYGVLVGEVKKGRGNTYVFVKGMIEVKEIIENSLIFNDEIWSDIYKNIKEFFNKQNIVGWFVSVPYRVSDDMKGIKKIHLDNFAGNDKVCFLNDRTEKEDGFYFYEQGNLKKQSGYYIYFEKNENMKKYVKSMSIKNESQSNEVKQCLKEGIKKDNKSKEHLKESNKKEKIVYAKNGEEKLHNKKELIPKTFKELFNEGIESRRRDEERRANKKGLGSGQPEMRMKGKFAYGLSGLLIIALLLSTVVMLNNYGELKNIKSSLSNLNNSKEAQAVNEILDSYGESESDGNSNETSSKTATKENKTTKVEEKQKNSTTKSRTETTSKSSTSTANNQSENSNETISQKSKSTTSSKVSKSVNSAHSGEYLKIKRGQTLYDISVKYYGTNKMIDEIKELNDIDDDYTIVEGQKILLP